MSPRDVNLQLADALVPLTTTGSSATPVECEGGFYAIVRFVGGTITTGIFDVLIEASVDGEETYGQIGSIPQIVDTDDDIEIARVVYIPRPKETAAGVAQTVTYVQLSWVSSATPSWPVDVWIEPLVSLAPPAIDEELAQGLCELKAA